MKAKVIENYFQDKVRNYYIGDLIDVTEIDNFLGNKGMKGYSVKGVCMSHIPKKYVKLIDEDEPEYILCVKTYGQSFKNRSVYVVESKNKVEDKYCIIGEKGLRKVMNYEKLSEHFYLKF